MPAPNTLQQREYLTVDNFSPGIFNDWYSSGGQPAPQGAAQLSGTFGCIASRQGSLIPAPRKVHTQTQALIDAAGSGKYPTGDSRIHILGMRNMSSVYLKKSNAGGPGGQPAVPAGNQTDYPDMPFLAMQWYYDAGGGSGPFTRKSRVRGYKCFNDAGGTYDMMTHSSAGTAAVGTKPWYGFLALEIGRANPAHSDTFGLPFVVAANAVDLGTPSAKVYPAYATAYQDSVSAPWFDTTLGMSILFVHQDRLFAIALGAPSSVNGMDNWFGSDGIVDMQEWLFYTDENNYTGGSTANNITLVNENPYGYGSWCSVNASMLLLVKKRGGAVLVRGDINNPQVIRLPGIESTGLASNIGVLLNDGTYLYGSERGVFAWSGGDTAQHLSPQLDGHFWKAVTPVSPTAGYSVVDQLNNPLFFETLGNYSPAPIGSFAMCGQRLVFAPNNFCYDLHGKGWWRHTDPAAGIIYGWHDSSVKDRVLAAPYIVGDSVIGTEAIAWFDPNLGQSAYQWTSQPLRLSTGRRTNPRDLSVVLRGHGVVTFQLVGINGAVSNTFTCTINSDARPVVLNSGMSVDSYDVCMVITSTAYDTDHPAPEVLRFTIGHDEMQTARA